MPWIACDVDFPFQPKTLDLADIMGWDPYAAAGRLLVFWGWCLRYAPDGDISRLSHARIAQGMGLPAVDGERLVEALVKSEWLDNRPYLRVHDWWSLVGLFLRGRYQKEPDRWQRIQKLYSGAALEPLSPTVHNSTVHNSTEHPPPRPAHEPENRDDDAEDGSKKIDGELKILKREIIRRSGMRRISSTDEEQLTKLLERHGERVVEACGRLHGGIENIPAYLTRVLEERDDTAALAERVEALINKGVA